MKRLVGYLRTYKWYFILATVAMFLGIGLDMFNPRLQQAIVDDVILHGQMEKFGPLLLGLFGITLGRVIFGYVKEYAFDFGAQKVVADLRQNLFDHLQTLSFTFFDGMNTGELMSRLKEDVDSVWRTIAFGAMLFIEQSTYFIVATVVLFFWNWKLAVVGVTVTPVIAILAVKLESAIGEVFGRLSDQGVIINTTAQENLAGVRLVKAFNREKYEIQKFLEQNQENYRLNMEQARIWGNFYPAIEFLTSLAVVLVTAAGGLLVMKEEITIGTLVAFSNYIFMLIWPMRMLGWLTNMLAQSRASMKKLEHLFAEQPTIHDPAEPKVPAAITGHIVFEDVGFVMNGNRILEHINLDLKPGKTLAIMGMTGSGKSSLINLIARYYDCTTGRIYLDGVNIRELPLKLLREQISVVMQDTFLFSDTIAANIRFGAPQATQEAVAEAAAAAKIYDFIQELPEGLETVIGERGIGLSGGQKQRIAIARALLKRSPVLILDDATSNLDMETEYQIQRELEAYRGVTKIIIAHRISAVKNADEIIWIENGTIVERGTHQQLMALGKRYYETYREQFQGLTGLEQEGVG